MSHQSQAWGRSWTQSTAVQLHECSAMLTTRSCTPGYWTALPLPLLPRSVAYACMPPTAQLRALCTAVCRIKTTVPSQAALVSVIVNPSWVGPSFLPQAVSTSAAMNAHNPSNIHQMRTAVTATLTGMAATAAQNSNNTCARFCLMLMPHRPPRLEIVQICRQLCRKQG